MRRIWRFVSPLGRDASVLLVGRAVASVGTGLTLPYLLVYLHRVRGLELGTAAFAVATIGIASFVGNPLGGVLADRIGAARTVALGSGVSAVGAFMLSTVTTPATAIVATAVVGLGAAVTWPAEDTLVASTVPPALRSRAFSLRFGVMNAGFGIGGLVTAAFVDVSSPRSFVVIYVLDALSFLLFAPVVLFLVSNPRRVAPPAGVGPRRGFRAVFGDRAFRRTWFLTAVIVTVGYGQYQSSFPAYATRPGGVTVGTLGVAFAANTLAVVAFQVVVLRYSDGYRRTRALMLVCGCWAATWAITVVGGAWGSGAAAAAAFVLAMVVFAAGETLLPPSLPALVNDMAPDHLRGRYNGVYTLAWTTGFTAGPLIAGYALGVGRPGLLFGGLVAACGLAALLASRLERHVPASVNVIGAPAA